MLGIVIPEIELLFWHDCVLQYLCTVIPVYHSLLGSVSTSFLQHIGAFVSYCDIAVCQSVQCFLAQWCNVMMRGR